MNYIAKSVVSNKLSSVGKNLGWDDKDDQEGEEGISEKELRKIQEKNAAARAKRQDQHAKRNAEREKKRDEIRAKYGLKEGQAKSNGSGSSSSSRKTSLDDIDTETTKEKQCLVM